MDESLELLLKLQNIDIEISSIRGRRESLPSRIEALELRMQEARQELEDREARLKNARLEIRQSESRVAQLDEVSNRYKQQLVGVKTNREYSALLTEIEGVKHEKAELEERIIGSMEEAEKLAGEVNESRRVLDEAEKTFAGERDQLSGEMKELDDEIAVHRQKRENLSVRVRRPVLNLYERIMTSRVNHAVVSLRNGSCGGCYAMVPLQKVTDIRKGGEIHTCESCGRILYFEENGNGNV